MIIFDILKKYSVNQFIKDLLKKRFSGLPMKQEVNESDDKLNFACPFCGDSEKDPRKKRGNFYLANNSYKCYNDGCGIKTDLSGMIKKFALKYGLTLPDTIINSGIWDVPTEVLNAWSGSNTFLADRICETFGMTPIEHTLF
jgi:hypothetical protein